jgi:hypothetical protein
MTSHKIIDIKGNKQLAQDYKNNENFELYDQYGNIIKFNNVKTCTDFYKECVDHLVGIGNLPDARSIGGNTGLAFLPITKQYKNKANVKKLRTGEDLIVNLDCAGIVSVISNAYNYVAGKLGLVDLNNYVIRATPKNASASSVNHTSGGSGSATTIEKKIDGVFGNGGFKQVVLTGAPGTGKTWSAKKYAEDKTGPLPNAKVEFVQFHPSYDYSDFVEGLRPVILAGSTSNDPTFVRMDGIFKKFCRKIVDATPKNPQQKNSDTEETAQINDNNDNNNFYFIIVEINRADLSRVFGELMYCLEESYRGDTNRIQTQYSNLETYEIDPNGKAIPITKTNDFFNDGFYIPDNLYIIGTMNDIDKSVESFDFALRRRFQWIEILTQDVAEDALKKILEKQNTIVNFDKEVGDLAEAIKKMNKIVSGDEGAKFGLSEA